MESDNVYPNDGTFVGGVPLEPTEQRIDRFKEKAQVLHEMPELVKMISRLRKRIKWYKDATNIPDDVRADPKEFLITHNSFTAAANVLTEEMEYLQGLIDAYAKTV